MRGLACLAILSALSLAAQDFPDAAVLAHRSSEALSSYGSIEYSMDMSTAAASSAIPLNFTMNMLFRSKGGKFRIEASAPILGSVLVAVMDGQDTWMYMPSLKQYTKTSAADFDIAQKILGSLTGAASADDSKMNSNAKVIRSEVLDVDGQSHDCWVTESQVAEIPNPASPVVKTHDVDYTVWYDKGMGMVLRTAMTAKVQISPSAPAMSMQMKMTMHGLKFNPALDDSLFVFTPPPDAKETAELIPGLSIAGPKEKSPVVAVAKPSAPAPGDPRAFVPNLSPLHDKEPVYPASAEGQSGMVHALVTIGATGNVVNVEVLSGKEIFRQAAIDAIQQRTYRPVIRDEKPVPAYTDAMVTFFQDKSAKGIESDFVADVGEEMKAAMRIQELTAAMPRTSAQVLGDLEQQDSGAGGIKRFYALSDLAKGALDAGLNDKAQSYANEMLTMAARYPEDWNYGNAIYTGNTVLGMVALRNGDVAQAKEYLLTSARISGSPQLDSFGPDFRLAKELAQKGEKDAVLQYLDLCRGFWKMGGEQLTSMEAAVRNGEAF